VESKLSADDLKFVRKRLNDVAGAWLKEIQRWSESSTSETWDAYFQYLAAYLLLLSSERLEKLTKRLNGLSIVLIVLTLVLVVMTVLLVIRG
jgi:hypothetical protein